MRQGGSLRSQRPSAAISSQAANACLFAARARPDAAISVAELARPEKSRHGYQRIGPGKPAATDEQCGCIASARYGCSTLAPSIFPAETVRSSLAPPSPTDRRLISRSAASRTGLPVASAALQPCVAPYRSAVKTVGSIPGGDEEIIRIRKSRTPAFRGRTDAGLQPPVANICSRTCAFAPPHMHPGRGHSVPRSPN